MDWIWIILALLVGLAVGGGVAYAVLKRRYGDRESVAHLRGEYDRYRGKVTEHFVETADLVNTLTRSYKRVYDHLEAGAYELVGEDTLRRQLDAPHEEPVMIEYLGQRRVERAVSAPEPEPTAPPPPAATRPTEDVGGPPSPPASHGSPTSARAEPERARQDSDLSYPSEPVRRDDLTSGNGASPAFEAEDDRADASDEDASEAEERTRSAG